MIHSLQTGKRNDSLGIPGFGQKFLGVTPGGAIDIFGRDKLSWTRLTETIRPQKRIFDIRDNDELKGCVNDYYKVYSWLVQDSFV